MPSGAACESRDCALPRGRHCAVLIVLQRTYGEGTPVSGRRRSSCADVLTRHGYGLSSRSETKGGRNGRFRDDSARRIADESPIDSDDLETVRELVSDTLARSFFGTRFQMATDAEQRYLAAMAAAGEPPYRVGDVATAYGVRDQRGVSVHRDGLIQKGLVWSPRRGQVDFTVPLFAEYLRENHPLESFE